MSRHDEQRQARLETLEILAQQGTAAYPAGTKRTHTIGAVRHDFDALEKKSTKITIAGRIMTIRGHGGSTFATVRDMSGDVQLFLKKDTLAENSYQQFVDLIHAGDIIEATGTAYRTKRGEPSVLVSSYQLLAKTLEPLPEKWHGLKDTDARMRRRYLDLLMDPTRVEIFKRRTAVIDTLRNELNRRGYLEVQTPVLQPLYGGTLAQPFKTHFNALDRDMYLRISNELYLKRLLVGGLEKVFEFSVDFRNEGIDTTHNPEFLQLETMTAYNDYHDSMQLLEDLVTTVVEKVTGGAEIEFQGTKINFKQPWKRISLPETLTQMIGVDVVTADAAALVAAAKKKKIPIEKSSLRNKGKIIEKLLDELIVPTCTNPTIVYDYPIETSPLAKEKADQPGWVERFEFFIAGRELGNVYSELNDPVLLRRNLKAQAAEAAAGDEETHPLDEDFIEALEVGLPPASGIGIGIDRLVMLLTNQTAIREVNFFPMLREK